MDDPTTEQVRLFLDAGESRSAFFVAILARLPLRTAVAALLAFSLPVSKPTAIAVRDAIKSAYAEDAPSGSVTRR